MKFWCCTLILCIDITVSLATIVVLDHRQYKISCKEFLSVIANASTLLQSENSRNSYLEQIGFLTSGNIFTANDCNEDFRVTAQNAKTVTIAAQIFRSQLYNTSDFQSLFHKCITEKAILNRENVNVHPKYRSIDGRGNNLKHPEWGAADTPFSRYGSINYDDGVYSIRKSVTGSDLPNARLIVHEVFLKAVRSSPPIMKYNLMSLLLILFVTHDFHYQVPIQTQRCRNENIRCCSKGNRDVLSPELSNSACIPIEVSKNDPFYKRGNVGCLNMVRSQLGKYTDDVETGAILNRATAYMDLSLIYGNSEAELKAIRRYEDGMLRMGKNNVLPVNSKNKYLPSMNRFVATPIGSIWPSLFARNHNNLAKRLAKMNNHWDDETVFQEARRINIAFIQFNVIATKVLEKIFNKVINASYSDEINAATSVEFAFTYRAGHYYVPSHMLLQNQNYTETKHLQSDTIGKIELLEDNFDDILRGATNQPINDGPFSDEIINKIGKNSYGYGVDLIAIDIQRGRDHGVPSFVEIRRKCKLTPEINSFDDFNKIFKKTNVDLLKRIYKSHEDVDFYVGGLLEIFESVASPFVGETFACVIEANYRSVMGGDIYFYSHPENPYPFTKAQIDAIFKYQLTNFFCTNSGMKETNKLWSFISNPMNPKVNCTHFPPMDLSAWKAKA